MTLQKFFVLLKAFQVPLIVLCAIILYLLLAANHLPMLSLIVAYGAILLGSYDLLADTVSSLVRRQFALDYIAILAIVVSLMTQQYIVAMVIALMTATGQKLEQYGAASAKASLTALIDRLPHEVLLVTDGKEKSTPLESIKVGQVILVRKGEVVGLDGTLTSKSALLDEASLTGEPYPVEKYQNDPVRSGTINVGDPFTLTVTASSQNSTYAKIIELVRSAEEEKAPLIRLADKYSTYFTVITFIIAAFAYLHTPTLTSILAVLVVATPCPLILATPIALLGGVNAAAKKRIIIKKLASIESLEKVQTIVFDKTGTITLGKPKVTDVTIHKKDTSAKELLAIAAAIERHSLHPLAKAIVDYAISQNASHIQAQNVTETIGKGISGKVDKKTYTLSKLPNQTEAMIIGLYQDKELLATFTFTDEVKHQSKNIITSLQNMGLSLFILTGDKKSVTENLVEQLGIQATIKAELSPEQKQEEVAKLKKTQAVAMVGDGINDAPALALADVGMVFSNQEQTAATDAADIVILGGNFSLVLETVLGAKRTLAIAKQSIFWGIGMSIFAMIAASWGFIPPLYGAILQEVIDVVVIINALRAAK